MCGCPDLCLFSHWPKVFVYFKYLFMCLTVLDFSCGMRDLPGSEWTLWLRHTGSRVRGLRNCSYAGLVDPWLVGSKFPDQGLKSMSPTLRGGFLTTLVKVARWIPGEVSIFNCTYCRYTTWWLLIHMHPSSSSSSSLLALCPSCGLLTLPPPPAYCSHLLPTPSPTWELLHIL